MKTRYLLYALLLLGSVVSAYAQDEYDDIYYSEPKRPTTPKNNKKGVSKEGTYYVPDMGSVDIDAYNRRGESYYVTPVDTIGETVASAPDYVYTQAIQQYYNPTIVINNSNQLAQVLNGSYGNVNVVYTGMTPYFLPTHSYTYNYWLRDPLLTLPWNPYFGLSGFSYDPGPWWTWNIYSPWGWTSPWYSSIGWNPVWYWGWGPSYGWNWGHNHHHHDKWLANHYRPNMHGNGYTRPGWVSSTRPSAGGNGNGHRGNPMASTPQGGGTTHRPGTSGYTATHRPGSMATAATTSNTGATSNHRPSVTTRPGASATATTRPSGNVSTTPYDRYAGSNASATSRPSTTARPANSTVRPANTSRPNTANTSRPANHNSNYNTSTYQYNNNSSVPRPAFSNGSSHRSTGGYSSGSSGNSGRSGGGGGGRHR